MRILALPDVHIFNEHLLKLKHLGKSSINLKVFLSGVFKPIWARTLEVEIGYDLGNPKMKNPPKLLS